MQWLCVLQLEPNGVDDGHNHDAHNHDGHNHDGHNRDGRMHDDNVAHGDSVL